MAWEFDDPDEVGGTRLNPRDVLGHLLLVWAIEYIPHSPTQYSRPDKPSDVIVVDVVDLDQRDEMGRPGLLARRSWWRQAQLIQGLRGRIGKSPVLVVMSKGSATTGRAAPFTLTSMKADQNSVARANAWAIDNPGFTPSTPGRQMEASPDPWQPTGDPVAIAPAQNLPPPRPREVTSQELTVLERMARMAQQDLSNQGPIPF